MPLSADWIEKPGPVVIIDDFFNGSLTGNDPYEFARGLLDDTEQTLDAITERLAGEGPGSLSRLKKDDADHFREHWLDRAPGKARKHPWNDPQVGEIMREAYLYAIEMATRHDPPLPIETFWVFIDKSEPFQMRVSDGPAQVTVFSLIPKTDKIQFGDLPPDAKVIKRFPEQPPA